MVVLRANEGILVFFLHLRKRDLCKTKAQILWGSKHLFAGGILPEQENQGVLYAYLIDFSAVGMGIHFRRKPAAA